MDDDLEALWRQIHAIEYTQDLFNRIHNRLLQKIRKLEGGFITNYCSYNPLWSWEMKISYVLTQKAGPFTVALIVEYLMDEEKDLDEHRANSNIQATIRRLADRGKIQCFNLGRHKPMYEYSLWPDDK